MRWSQDIKIMKKRLECKGMRNNFRSTNAKDYHWVVLMFTVNTN